MFTVFQKLHCGVSNFYLKLTTNKSCTGCKLKFNKPFLNCICERSMSGQDSWRGCLGASVLARGLSGTS